MIASNKKQLKKLIGHIHSIESFGTLDGPGVRTVIFFQGCPLLCQYCHNVDCATKGTGTTFSVSTLVKTVLKDKPYWESYTPRSSVDNTIVHGGVTLSGGEPLFQPAFLLAFLKQLAKHNIHIAVDSSLFTSPKIIESIAPYVDLWMVSIKHMFSSAHKKLTGVENKQILDNILSLDSLLNKQKDKGKIRIRYVVVPMKTNDKGLIRELGQFVKQLKNLETIELLPYGSHGKFKWIENFDKYPLEGIRDANRDDLRRVKDILSQFDLTIKY